MTIDKKTRIQKAVELQHNGFIVLDLSTVLKSGAEQPMRLYLIVGTFFIPLRARFIKEEAICPACLYALERGCEFLTKISAEFIIGL